MKNIPVLFGGIIRCCYLCVLRDSIALQQGTTLIGQQAQLREPVNSHRIWLRKQASWWVDFRSFKRFETLSCYFGDWLVFRTRGKHMHGYWTVELKKQVQCLRMTELVGRLAIHPQNSVTNLQSKLNISTSSNVLVGMLVCTYAKLQPPYCASVASAYY